MRWRVDWDAWLAGREFDAIRVRVRARVLERGVLWALTLKLAMSGTVTVCLTFAAGDEAAVVVRDAVRREALERDAESASTSRCLDLELGLPA